MSSKKGGHVGRAAIFVAFGRVAQAFPGPEGEILDDVDNFRFLLSHRRYSLSEAKGEKNTCQAYCSLEV